jgi:hypothetical protein
MQVTASVAECSECSPWVPQIVQFGGQVFKQTIGIPMGTNWATLLADVFLHAYKADFHQGLLQNKVASVI